MEDSKSLIVSFTRLPDGNQCSDVIGWEGSNKDWLKFRPGDLLTALCKSMSVSLIFTFLLQSDLR